MGVPSWFRFRSLATLERVVDSLAVALAVARPGVVGGFWQVLAGEDVHLDTIDYHGGEGTTHACSNRLVDHGARMRQGGCGHQQQDHHRQERYGECSPQEIARALPPLARLLARVLGPVPRIYTHRTLATVRSRSCLRGHFAFSSQPAVASFVTRSGKPLPTDTDSSVSGGRVDAPVFPLMPSRRKSIPARLDVVGFEGLCAPSTRLLSRLGKQPWLQDRGSSQLRIGAVCRVIPVRKSENHSISVLQMCWHINAPNPSHHSGRIGVNPRPMATSGHYWTVSELGLAA